MADVATPNLPSRDFDATLAFYAPLGFALHYRDDAWMILERGPMLVEFFPWPDLDPATSSFGSCLRVDDLDGLWTACLASGVPVRDKGFPRLAHPPHLMPWGGRMAALIDLDGSLIRMLQN